MNAYAGIGSRETPPDVLSDMRAIARQLATKGWTLRSGAADGADRAFEEGALDAAQTPYRGAPRPEVYLPWPSFNEDNRAMIGTRYYITEPQPEAFAIARQHHPAWHRCTGAAKSLHARNVHQILGPDVTRPILSRFVICWTKGGEGGGGTGQALRIAKHYGVPCFDLARQADYDRIVKGLFS